MIRSIAIAAAALACLAANSAFAGPKNAQCARLYDSALTNNENITEMMGRQTVPGIVFDAGDGVRAQHTYTQTFVNRVGALSHSLGALTDFGRTINFGGEDWAGVRAGVTANDDWETPLTTLHADLVRAASSIQPGAAVSPQILQEVARISRAFAAVNRGNCR